MDIITLSPSKEAEREHLFFLYEEALPYFKKIEGRDPLPPLDSLQEILPDLPHSSECCFSIYYLDQIIGYLRLFEPSDTEIYILYFYISQNYRKLGFGSLVVKQLEKLYSQRNFKTAELLVSANNYSGLNFWRSAGFNQLTYVYPAESFETLAVELELLKELHMTAPKQTGLIPVTKENQHLAVFLQVTPEQQKAGLILSVPEAVKLAFDNPSAKQFFILLDSEVIGYTSMVFDNSIPEPNMRNWLWQFVIDKNYQNRGYATSALKNILQVFKANNAEIITLSTKPENRKALQLYQKFGFVSTGNWNGAEIILQRKSV